MPKVTGKLCLNLNGDIAIKQSLFKRSRFLGLRTSILALLSVVLMFVDHRTHYFDRIQYVSSAVALPFQYAIDWPIEFGKWVGDSVVTQHQVLEENAQLRAEQLLLKAKLQRVAALENENTQLRALLQASPHVGGRFTVAQLLEVNMDPFVQKVVLDKGSNDKIYVGQPVLDAYGVLGQVVSVGPRTSQVMLITDVQSGIPVQDSRNGVRAIAAGTTNGLQLVNVPNTTDIQVGDVLVTSGLEQRYPPGYPVGIVKTVKRDREFRFAGIGVQPSARMNSGSQVLLVWPNDTTTPDNPEKKPVNAARLLHDDNAAAASAAAPEKPNVNPTAGGATQ